MWRLYTKMLVFTGALCFVALGEAKASPPQGQRPLLTDVITCARSYWTTFQSVEQLNMVPPCQFGDNTSSSRRDIAYFGNSRLIYQGDGNLVIYPLNGGPAAWSSGTAGIPSYLVFQADGNLVIYEWLHNQGLWSSNTWKGCTQPGQEKTLTFQQDGNLVIYCHQPDGSMNAMWSTNTQMR